MPLLCDFPSPPVALESFAGGFTSKGVPLLTLDGLEGYSTGKGNRTERLYKCPFCGAGERAFHLNTRTGAFNCKRSSCGVRGVLREFWPQQERTSMSTGARARRDTARPFAPAPQPKVPQVAESDLSNWRPQWNGALALDALDAGAGRDFLSVRGLSVPVALATGTRFCPNWAPSPEGKNYSGGAAVLYPLRSLDGEVVAVNGRYIEPRAGQPKARTGGALQCGAFFAPSFDGHSWISPLDFRTPFVVEGPADALALAVCGVPTLAVGGCCFPEWLADALALTAPVLAPDADEAGAKALPKWKSEIESLAPRFRVLRPDIGKDFGEMLQSVGRAEMRARLRAVDVCFLDRDKDERALACLSPSVRVQFPRAVAIEIGHGLLALDAGKEIE